MKNILILTIFVHVFASGAIMAYAQGGSRSIQPPDFCTAFPNDVNCGGEGKEDAPVDPLPSPQPAPNQPVQGEAAPAPEPTKPPEESVAQPSTNENQEPVANKDENKPKAEISEVSNTGSEVEKSNSKSTKNNENRVLIGLLKILTYMYLAVTGFLFALFALIGLATFVNRKNKNLGPIPSGFIRVPLICGGFVLLGLVALFVLQSL